MLDTGNWKQKLGFMALGSMFTIIGALIGVFFTMLLLPFFTAQRDTFDTIQCSRLEVVGADGETRVILKGAERGGLVVVTGADGQFSAGLGIGKHGGEVSVTGKGEGKAAMGIDDYGSGTVSVYDKNGYLQSR